MSMLRALPRNDDAEVALLGAILANPRAAERCVPLLRREMFFLRAHTVLCDLIAARATRGEPIDAITLRPAFLANDLLADAGGEAYLQQLVECAATPIAAEQYLFHLADLARQRELIGACDDISALAHDPGDLDAEQITDLAKTRFTALNGMRPGAGPPIPYFSFADLCPVLSGLWLIKGVLPRQGVAVIYGPSGGGKTFVALDLLIHIARGEAWRGRRTARTGVLYLAPDGGSAMANRVEAYRRHHGVAAADLAIVSSPVDLLGKIAAADAQKVERLIAYVERAHGQRIGVIAIDTVSRAMPGGDENLPADMSRFIDNLGRLGGNGERLAIVIHHTPKCDATVIRGHGSLHGAADCEFNVFDQCIRVAKQRDGADDLQFGFRLEVVEIGHDEDGDAVTSCVAVPTEVSGDEARPRNKPRKLTRSMHGGTTCTEC